MKNTSLLFLFLSCFILNLNAQNSVARQWNEQVLESIRNDLARPTVHARNLFHTSIAMYDIWAFYEGTAETYFLGKTVNGFHCPLTCLPQMPVDIKAAQEEAMSYAVFRLIEKRFENAPRERIIMEEAETLMRRLGYDISNTSINYSNSPAGMGNYIAERLIEYGLQDGSNEENQYENKFYEPVNDALLVGSTGNSGLTDFNRWQPLRFRVFVDQSGNPTGNPVPDFLSPEWGQVFPFSLQEDDLNIYERDGGEYWVYHDPGAPALWNSTDSLGLEDDYKWGNALVALWSSHLAPDDSVMWDISPGAKGNIQSYPYDISGLRDFYNFEDGGDYSIGHAVNPKTGQPYEPNVVPRGDYARVLAEFWADGPDSETPPGHWFTILNYVNDQPSFEKKMKGEGEILNDLEWDVKAYFALGGAMHDSAISAWGIKGWYDYIRPVSAIRGMARLGQSSDPNLPNYHPGGLPLVPGFIELIEATDSLSGEGQRFTNELKILAWKGPDEIRNPVVDEAGVGWIRAAEWLPYQRSTFVTPPFAGYVSGHSTYSRAAAEVLTALTGDPFFPGGMGVFNCQRNRFLVFEDGPSVTVNLQWATYQDASDQCSLSRIWGGIHPPVDDIPGRLIGEKIGVAAFDFAESYFVKKDIPDAEGNLNIYPNPTDCGAAIEFEMEGDLPFRLYGSGGQLEKEGVLNFSGNRANVDLADMPAGVYILIGGTNNEDRLFEQKIIKY